MSSRARNTHKERILKRIQLVLSAACAASVVALAGCADGGPATSSGVPQTNNLPNNATLSSAVDDRSQRTSIFTGAMASGFSGKWPLTITRSKGNNGKFCLTLTDNGSAGFPHSGPAAINDGVNGQALNGQFQFINNVIIVAIDDVGLTMNAGSTFSTRPVNGGLGGGAFATIYDGQEIDEGAIVFGPKGSC